MTTSYVSIVELKYDHHCCICGGLEIDIHTSGAYIMIVPIHSEHQNIPSSHGKTYVVPDRKYKEILL